MPMICSVGMSDGGRGSAVGIAGRACAVLTRDCSVVRLIPSASAAAVIVP
jgi:hypothetical protein